MASVLLERVSRVFPGGVTAVDQLDLHVRDGELLVLVGPSGCGKTTTLRLIAGLEPLSSGDIQIGDRKVNRLAPRERDVAMVFQGHALYPHLTVFQNLAFGLELRCGGKLRQLWRGRLDRRRAGRTPAPEHSAGGTPTPQGVVLPGQIRPRVLAAARTLGIEALLARMPAELSGGERQRVALGRALVREPAVFLFDEPLSNLDALLRASLRSELKRLHQSLAATMIYVTHDQAEALSLGDRIAVLDGGRLQQIGEPLRVYHQPANRFVAGFLGSPPMNLVEATLERSRSESGAECVVLRGGGWIVNLEPCYFPSDMSSGRVVWGVRPENIQLSEATPHCQSPTPSAQSPVPSPQSPAPGSQPGRIRLTGWVNLIEPLGDTAVVHFAPLSADTASPAEENRVLLLKTSDLGGARVSERIEAWFDAARLHWFDALTGRSVRGFEASNGN
ncbi:MAG TPA: ABC transporter ATP-binding protein [Pirellulales bacterium]|nr:ABC transporter ATP-binding protein [Pirellulales bacterium]